MNKLVIEHKLKEVFPKLCITFDLIQYDKMYSIKNLLIKVTPESKFIIEQSIPPPNKFDLESEIISYIIKLVRKNPLLCLSI